jgi:hypothetical protein
VERAADVTALTEAVMELGDRRPEGAMHHGKQ